MISKILYHRQYTVHSSTQVKPGFHKFHYNYFPFHYLFIVASSPTKIRWFR